MIPDEALDAAIKELWDVNQHDDVWVDDFATYDDFLRHKARTVLEAAAPHMMATTEWQVRAPEDRGDESAWMSNSEAGAAFLRDECNFEVRSRAVTEWTADDRKPA